MTPDLRIRGTGILRDSIELLIKPASSLCNLRCSYCFYADVADNRSIPSYGIMGLDVLERIVEKAIINAKEHVSFSFQGGEPTLAGLDFFKKLIELEKKYNTRDINISHAIQTNGYTIDDEWAEFFAKNNFMVGVSVDGDAKTHNKYRVNSCRQGTHGRIMHSISVLKKHQIKVNILTVVTADVARNARKIYDYYKENDLLYQQYIPCLDPFVEEKGKFDYSLTPQLYATFLKDMFDCWYDDIKSGQFIYNRYFENLVGMIKGYHPESCGMLGHCLPQYVVEADGGVYPCDFYVLDRFKIGNLTTDSFTEIDKKRRQIEFIEDSAIIHPDCLECKWLNICRGGCRRNRDMNGIGEISKNYFCESYKEFFSYAFERLSSF
jgi:uncharacterized protein